MGFASSVMAQKQPRVDRKIGGDNDSRQQILNLARQPVRINRCHQIVLDKAATVASLSCAMAKIIFELGKRADPTQIFDEKSPGGSWKLKQRNPAPLQREQCPKRAEQNKCKVEQQYGIGSKERGHRCTVCTQ
jgi:hypothetical protein